MRRDGYPAALLPDEWDEWPESAQREWLTNNFTMRNVAKLVALEATGETPDLAHSQGALTTGGVVDLYFHVREALDA